MTAPAAAAPLDLPSAFADAVKQAGTTFLARGLLDDGDLVFPLGTDSKVLSTVFEMLARPLIYKIADKHGYSVEESKQTVYPDFTLLLRGQQRGKIAIDIKTTYKKPQIGFTLGSYTSFLRNGTKNILYPYQDYAAHWVIGFVYARADNTSQKAVDLKDRQKLVIPYKDVDWFVQEKHKIAGEDPGSGNTANIGSMHSIDIDDFRHGKGPFAKHGESVFKDYWANYVSGKKAVRIYSTVTEFLAWKKSKP